jgi:hypothetical protein
MRCHRSHCAFATGSRRAMFSRSSRSAIWPTCSVSRSSTSRSSSAQFAQAQIGHLRASTRPERDHPVGAAGIDEQSALPWTGPCRQRHRRAPRPWWRPPAVRPAMRRAHIEPGKRRQHAAIGPSGDNRAAPPSPSGRASPPSSSASIPAPPTPPIRNPAATRVIAHLWRADGPGRHRCDRASAAGRRHRWPARIIGDIGWGRNCAWAMKMRLRFRWKQE